jgi:hypothetical protein
LYCLAVKEPESLIAGNLAVVPSENAKVKTDISSLRTGAGGGCRVCDGTIDGSFSMVIPPWVTEPAGMVGPGGEAGINAAPVSTLVCVSSLSIRGESALTVKFIGIVAVDRGAVFNIPLFMEMFLCESLARSAIPKFIASSTASP